MFNQLRDRHKTAKRCQKNPISYKSGRVKWRNFGDPKLFIQRYEIVICRYQKLTKRTILCPICPKSRVKWGSLFIYP